MNSQRNKLLSLLVSAIFVAAGCNSVLDSDTGTQVAYVSPSSPTPNNTPFKTSTLQPHQTATTTPFPTLRPTDTATPTSIPTLSSTSWPSFPTLSKEESQSLLNELLSENAGCKLPCFWGITPGLSTFDDVLSFLGTFTMILGINEGSGNIRILYARIPFPEGLGTISHSYVFEHNIVRDIQAYNFDLAPPFHLPAFMETYGEPSEVRISTFSKEEQNSRPFLLDLFYPRLGILMEYSGGNVVDLGDKLQNCLLGMNSPFIYLWDPEREMTFDEAAEQFLYLEEMKRIPLIEATGVDVPTFYKGFRESDTFCIETPKDLWP